MAASPTDMVSRTNTTGSDDDVPIGDPTSTMGLLLERVRAYKHMVGNLEDYVKVVAKNQATSAKEQEKILKSISQPLQENHHFDPENRGIAGLFENLRSNSSAVMTLNIETGSNLQGTVLPALERVHKELKAKFKELESGSAKQAKTVEKSRLATQKHIDLLGHHSSNFDTGATGTKADAGTDPYILQKGINYRLNQQISDENNARSDLLTVQNAFGGFESHVLDTIQNALSSFSQVMGDQAQREGTIYAAMASNARAIPQDYEWQGFVHRNQASLIDPRSPLRSMSNTTFPNQNHRSTQPLIEGTLERKARGVGALTGYKTYHYALTPAGYLHEFKDTDDFKKDPTPEISLNLSDCSIGSLDGTKFSIKGKDTSGGKVSSKMSLSSEWQFKAQSPGDAAKWYAAVMESVTSKGAENTGPAAIGGVVVGGAGTEQNQTQAQPPAAAAAPPQQQGLAGTMSQQEQGVTPHTQPQQTTGTIAQPSSTPTATEKELLHKQQVQQQVQALTGQSQSQSPQTTMPESAGPPPVYRPPPTSQAGAGQESGVVASPTQSGPGAGPGALDPIVEGVPVQSPTQGGGQRQVSSPLASTGPGMGMTGGDEGVKRSTSGSGQGSHFGKG